MNPENLQPSNNELEEVEVESPDLAIEDSTLLSDRQTSSTTRRTCTRRFQTCPTGAHPAGNCVHSVPC
ncbi:MAG: hypothetical protein N4J56_007369 [Chroococcidiopsis sp. SAG 2025]|jgi:hypothetical protein|uniref:hypothetical protein n=1 Tax=Chroococcidiopsis sp. SAG 2025 TaxID=171389 RepID=UPI002936EC31|nr:hypothetical protein [Chroococcidiopsis sp. SAG 2025]MDV2997664.1 hypothetical protein [Chroococcidiopsis sp. SAG 2025]